MTKIFLFINNSLTVLIFPFPIYKITQIETLNLLKLFVAISGSDDFVSFANDIELANQAHNIYMLFYKKKLNKIVYCVCSNTERKR